MSIEASLKSIADSLAILAQRGTGDVKVEAPAPVVETTAPAPAPSVETAAPAPVVETAAPVAAITADELNAGLIAEFKRLGDRQLISNVMAAAPFNAVGITDLTAEQYAPLLAAVKAIPNTCRMSEGHARLGPSNHRWPHCPGSVREEAAYPDIPGAAAIDGTGSHLLLEMCLDNNVPALHYDRRIIGENHKDSPNGWHVNVERCTRVQMCLDYISGRVEALRREFDGAYTKILVEAESISNPGGTFGRDDWWGTCDITITVINSHNRCLFMEVIDYKDGRMWVDEKDNTQLISYIGGKLRPYWASGPELVRPLHSDKVGGCRMTIVQPKTSKPVRSHDMHPEDIITRLSELSMAAHKTDDPNAPLIADDKGGKGYCKWCKHKPNCTAESEKSIQEVENMSNDLINMDSGGLIAMSPEQLTSIPSEDLVKAADTEAGIMAGYKRILDEIERRIDSGQPVNGYAKLPGNDSQVYNSSEEDIVKALKSRRFKKDDIYPSKLISPAQVMKSKLLDEKQKERFAKEYITKKAGADRLQRVAYEQKEKASAEELFSDVVATQEPAEEVSFLDAPSTPTEEVSFF